MLAVDLIVHQEARLRRAIYVLHVLYVLQIVYNIYIYIYSIFENMTKARVKGAKHNNAKIIYRKDWQQFEWKFKSNPNAS